MCVGKASGIVDRCAETMETLTFEDFEKSGSSSDLLDENILNNDTMYSPFTSTNHVYGMYVWYIVAKQARRKFSHAM